MVYKINFLYVLLLGTSNGKKWVKIEIFVSCKNEYAGTIIYLNNKTICQIISSSCNKSDNVVTSLF